MKRPLLTALSLSLALGCHHAASTDPWGRVLERGGELADVSLDQQKVTVTNSTITSWGVIEVPDGSRLQATYAGVDAIARSELLKLIRVRVADVMVSVDSTDPARRDAFEHTIEVVGGTIRHAGIPRHGWERVQRDKQVILRVWARLDVPRAELDSAMRSAGDLELPADMLEELESPR